jgi:hypothetical protein
VRSQTVSEKYAAIVGDRFAAFVVISVLAGGKMSEYDWQPACAAHVGHRRGLSR